MCQVRSQSQIVDKLMILLRRVSTAISIEISVAKMESFESFKYASVLKNYNKVKRNASCLNVIIISYYTKSAIYVGKK